MGAPPSTPIRITAFGTLAAGHTVVSVSGAAAQRKPLALLAVLAAAGNQGASREKLLLYFWPESNTRRARHALAQLIHILRRDFHDGQLVLRTSTLRLNPASMTSDVGEFEAALEAGELERAVELYRGPFLDGFYLKDAPEFERWAEGARARLTQGVSAALEALATRSARQGDHRGAGDWWRRLVLVEPLNSHAVVGLMNALASFGDRAGALGHARAYERLLRRELDLSAHPDVTSLANQLRGSAPAGDRLVLPEDRLTP